MMIRNQFQIYTISKTAVSQHQQLHKSLFSNLINGNLKRFWNLIENVDQLFLYKVYPSYTLVADLIEYDPLRFDGIYTKIFKWILISKRVRHTNLF